MRDLELSLLKTFVAVVETGSLTAGGKRVGRTQPAVTYQLNRLEQAVGRSIFDADKGKLVLTSDGELLLQFASAFLRINEDARRHFSAPEIEGRVVLGTPDLYAATLLPNILKDFSRSYPKIEVDLRCRRSVFLQQSLEHGELDLLSMLDRFAFGPKTFKHHR
ncbi:hypothetical protein BH10PSE7_BH10PSE7_04950 [soil metagenome]